VKIRRIGESWSLALGACATACACTSVRWQGPSGIEHHVGLLAYSVHKLDRGERLCVTTFGLDLRLSGPDAGYTIGFRTSEEDAPDVVPVADPDALAPLVDAFLAGDRGAGAAPAAESGFFWLSQNVGMRSAWIDVSSVGVDWRFGPTSPGLSLGYANATQLIGPALDEDVVLVRARDPGDSDREALVLWRLLAPRNPSEAFVALDMPAPP